MDSWSVNRRNPDYVLHKSTQLDPCTVDRPCVLHLNLLFKCLSSPSMQSIIILPKSGTKLTIIVMNSD